MSNMILEIFKSILLVARCDIFRCTISIGRRKFITTTEIYVRNRLPFLNLKSLSNFINFDWLVKHGKLRTFAKKMHSGNASWKCSFNFL